MPANFGESTKVSHRKLKFLTAVGDPTETLQPAFFPGTFISVESRDEAQECGDPALSRDFSYSDGLCSALPHVIILSLSSHRSDFGGYRSGGLRIIPLAELPTGTERCPGKLNMFRPVVR